MKFKHIIEFRLSSPKEFQRFGDFICSPFFNTEPRFIKLYKLIELEGIKISKEIISKKFFGSGTSTSEPRFRKLISEFMKLFERFLAEIEFSKDTLNQKFAMLEQYQKKNFRNEYLKQSDKIIEYIKKETIYDELYYKNLLETYARRYAVEEVNFKDYRKDLSFKINDLMDKYFIAMKLFVFQRFATLEYSFNVNLSQNRTFENEILNYQSLKNEELKANEPEIYLRYLALKLQTQWFDTDIYNEYVKTLDKKAKEFRINEYAFYSTLINLISGFINQGHQGMETKLLKVCDKMERKSLFVNHGIVYTDFKIFVETAIKVGKYDWAIEFILKNGEFIKQENSNNISNLMLGKLFFFKNEFGKSRNFLSKVAIEDYFHYSEAKLIECRIEFELENYNRASEIINTSQKFLKLHKDIGKHFLKVYGDFLKCIAKLIKLLEKGLSKTDLQYELDKLETHIFISKVPIYAQNWLVNKIQIYKKGKL